MHNPFSIYWNKNWTFQIVHMEEGIYIEAKGVGVTAKTPFFPTENLFIAADKLFYNEEKKELIVLISLKNMVKFSSIQLPISPEHVLVQHQFL